ncbi:MAG: hypothetical protein ACR2JY_04185 [Chloroflexota bacterium]
MDELRTFLELQALQELTGKLPAFDLRIGVIAVWNGGTFKTLVTSPPAGVSTPLPSTTRRTSWRPRSAAST